MRNKNHRHFLGKVFLIDAESVYYVCYCLEKGCGIHNLFSDLGYLSKVVFEAIGEEWEKFVTFSPPEIENDMFIFAQLNSVEQSQLKTELKNLIKFSGKK